MPSSTTLLCPSVTGRSQRTRHSGAPIEVECRPWLEDNQWVLDIAAKDKIIVGTVGDLEPGKPDFRKHLERFHRNPLFRGIRYGNLWDRKFREQLTRPDFISDLKALAEAGLELDSAQPDPALIADVVRLTDQIPSLRIVIDHLPQVEPATEPQTRRAYEANLRELGKRPQVYVKLLRNSPPGRWPCSKTSNFISPTTGRAVGDFWRGPADVSGSDSAEIATPGEHPPMFGLVSEYVKLKGKAVAEKFFWRNSCAAYRWVKRDPSQPEPPRV